MAEFKKGDRVIAIDSSSQIKKGWEGTFVGRDKGSVLVEWDELTTGHGGHREWRCQSPHGWWVSPKCIKPIKGGNMVYELKDKDVIEKGDLIHWARGKFGKHLPNCIEEAESFVGLTVARAKAMGTMVKATRPGGKKMTQEREYPKEIYRKWLCETNNDLDMTDAVRPIDSKTDGEIAVYVLKEVVTVTMKPRVTKKK